MRKAANCPNKKDQGSHKTSNVIMSAMSSQITGLTRVYSTVYSGADQRKHRRSASLAFVRGIHRWPVNSPHKRAVTRKMFLFDGATMLLTILSPVGGIKDSSGQFIAHLVVMIGDLHLAVHMYVSPWASFQIRKIAGCACTGNAGNVFPTTDFKRNRHLAIPACITARASRMSWSLTRGSGENVPGIPGACATAILRFWQEAHGKVGKLLALFILRTVYHLYCTVSHKRRLFLISLGHIL